MANNITGPDPWHLLLGGARAANRAITPMDSPTCLTRPGEPEGLPDELQDDVVFVETATELLAGIETHWLRQRRKFLPCRASATRH